ncbi:DUF6779 domain-containing protein [Corynebacterium frankenforstense]
MTRPNAHEDTEYSPAGSVGRWGTPGPDTGSAVTHGPAAADTARINRVPDDAVSDDARGPRRRGAADPAGQRAYEAGAQAPADSGAGSGEASDSGAGSGSGLGEGRAGNWLLIVLVALALIASIVMLLTDSSVALRLALLAALWAAVIGFFLVVRYRRAAETARKELEYTQNLREAEKARSSAEADAVRARGGAPAPAKEVNLREEDMQLLAEIRDSLAELRHQIEDLRGQAFEYEPAALRAQAWRLQELETRAQDSGLGPWGSAASAKPAETQHREKAGHVSGAPSVDAVAGRLGAEESQSSGTPTISPELAELLREENDSLAANRATVRQTQMGPAADQQAQTTPAQKPEQAKPAQKEAPQQADAVTSTTSTSTRAENPAQAAQQQPKPAQPKPQPAKPADKSAATATTAPTVHTEPSAEAPKIRRGQHRAPEADTAATETTTRSQSARKDGKDAAETGADAWRTGTETPAEETGRGHHEAPAEPRGRRRADERSGALTVAELLARRNK